MTAAGRITRAAAGLRPPTSVRALTASLMTGHYGGDSPWGNVDRSSADRFRATTNHARCATIWAAWQAWHMDARGFADVAYNFGACPHGWILDGRGPGVRSGAQFGDTNGRTFAWCYIAGAGDPFTPQAAAAVHHETTTRYGLRTTRDHSTWQNTACAGDPIRAWIAAGANPPTGDDDMSQTERFMTDNEGKIPDEFERGAWAVLNTNHNAGMIPTILARLNALTGKVDGIANALTGGTPDDVIAYLEEHLASLADQIAAIDTSDGGSGSELSAEQLVQLFADALLAGIGSGQS